MRRDLAGCSKLSSFSEPSSASLHLSSRDNSALQQAMIYALMMRHLENSLSSCVIVPANFRLWQANSTLVIKLRSIIHFTYEQ